MVEHLQCDSCLEEMDPQKAQQVSLAPLPKLWQAVKMDTFGLEASQGKRFLCSIHGCRDQFLARVFCFMEQSSRQRFKRLSNDLSSRC